MSKNQTTSPVLVLMRAACLALAAGTAVASWAAAAPTAPSQSPLISRVSNPPNPNVMIDIDDSGSMQAQYMPEGSTHLTWSNPNANWTQPALPALSSFCDLIDVFEGDQQKRGYSCNPLPAGVSYAIPGNTDTNTGVFQRWMRSSDVNSIYYNPAVLYQPWQYVDATGKVVRMADATYKAAYWNPASQTLGTADLSKNAIITRNFCANAAASSCASKKIQYDNGLFYVLKNDGATPPKYTADPNLLASFTEYDLNNGVAATMYPASQARVCTGLTNCCASVATGCTQAQEQQNFANWFQYYRTRTHLVKGSLSEALPNVMNKIRVAWGTINTDAATVDGAATTGVVVSGMRDLDASQLRSVLSGIQKIDPYNGTPLRQATKDVGNYFSRTDKGSPWANVPGTDGNVSSCRRSYHLMTTDGYWNDSATVGDTDSKDGPDYADADHLASKMQTHYVAALPYKDSQSDRLADFAMKYYETDLQTSVANKITPNPSTGDIAFWQHLSMFTVGLGVRGALDPNTDLPALTKGTKTWGTDKIDDLWHAAVDSHGAFFSAKDSTSLAAALTTALGAAAASPHNESGASTSGTSLTTNTTEYLPSYKSVQWTGELTAYKLDPQTGAPAKKPDWLASHVLPTFDKRNLWTWDGSNTSVKFDTSMSSTLKSLITTTTTTQDKLINYLRGDAGNEGASGFRARFRDTDAMGNPYGLLGDFLDSPPTIVQNFVDLQYDNIANTTSYRDFYNVKNTRPYGVIFEGANDGILHAFRSTDGVEIYGYIPYTVMGNLATLAAQDYGLSSNFHRNFVDGPQTETDAFIPTKRQPTASWANLLLGSYGAGAPGFYALDTTDTSTFDQKTLLWESAQDNDVGYIYEPIPVGPIPAAPTQTGGLVNGSWKAFVGNGVYSKNGNAVLLIVDVATGKIDKKVTLDSSGNNGLMGVTLLRDSNNAVIAAYAGDLKGNLYRIEFTGNNAPVESFNKAPFFKAVDASGNAQPITVPPLVYPNPLGGNTLLFGTGRLIDATDPDSTAPQTFYGVWDKTVAGTSAETVNSPFASAMASNTQRTLLVEQVVTSVGGGLYNVTANKLDPSKDDGWFMDLTPVSASQRVLYPALAVSGDVLINTTGPAPLSSDPCTQVSGTSSYFLIGALDGQSSPKPVWDTNDSGNIDANDNVAAGYTAAGAGQNTVVMVPGSKMFVNVTAGGNRLGRPPGGGKTIYQRVWQQLMTPPF